MRLTNLANNLLRLSALVSTDHGASSARPLEGSGNSLDRLESQAPRCEVGDVGVQVFKPSAVAPNVKFDFGTSGQARVDALTNGAQRFNARYGTDIQIVRDRSTFHLSGSKMLTADAVDGILTGVNVGANGWCLAPKARSASADAAVEITFRCANAQEHRASAQEHRQTRVPEATKSEPTAYVQKAPPEAAQQPSDIDPRLVRLPDVATLQAKLRNIEPITYHWGFHPFITAAAGRELYPEGVDMMLELAIYDYAETIPQGPARQATLMYFQDKKSEYRKAILDAAAESAT